jgi:starch-binding outer membrane protein, SusD/RagB family
LGKPKFKVGDTAIWVTMERLSPRIKKDSLYASTSYYYIPRDRQTNAEFPQNYKFYDNKRPAASEENGTRDWYTFRLGETYLIAAEAYGRKGNFTKAAERLNVVRKRAAYKDDELKPREYWQTDGGNFADRLKSTESNMALTAADLSKLTGLDFVDFMLDERGRELHGECLRWWDLVRAERLYDRVKKYNPEATNIQQYHKLRPIPQNHIDRLSPKGALNEEQNEGYF